MGSDDDNNISDIELFVQLLAGRQLNLNEYKQLYESNNKESFLNAFKCFVILLRLKTSWIPIEIIRDFENNSFDISKYTNPLNTNIIVQEKILEDLEKLNKNCNILTEIDEQEKMEKNDIKNIVRTILKKYAISIGLSRNIYKSNNDLDSAEKITNEIKIVSGKHGMPEFVEEIFSSSNLNPSLQPLRDHISNFLKEINIDCDNFEIKKNILQNNIKKLKDVIYEFKSHNMVGGVKFNNRLLEKDIHYHKYLKYKKKYLDRKNQK